VGYGRRVPDLRSAAGVPRRGCPNGMRDLPQDRPQQDQVHEGAPCLRRLPHEGTGCHPGDLLGRGGHGPRGHRREDHGIAVLPHAWPGAPCHRRLRPADGLPQRGRGSRPVRGPARDDQEGHGHPGRGVRVLGRLRRRDKRGDVRLDSDGRHAAVGGVLGALQQDDLQSAGLHRGSRRPQMLQEGHVPGHPVGRRFRQGGARRGDDQARDSLHPLREQRPVHSRQVPLLEAASIQIIYRARDMPPA